MPDPTPTRGFSPTGYITFGVAILAIVLFVFLLVSQRGCSQDVESGADGTVTQVHASAPARLA